MRVALYRPIYYPYLYLFTIKYICVIGTGNMLACCGETLGGVGGGGGGTRSLRKQEEEEEEDEEDEETGVLDIGQTRPVRERELERELESSVTDEWSALLYACIAVVDRDRAWHGLQVR